MSNFEKHVILCSTLLKLRILCCASSHTECALYSHVVVIIHRTRLEKVQIVSKSHPIYFSFRIVVFMQISHFLQWNSWCFQYVYYNNILMFWIVDWIYCFRCSCFYKQSFTAPGNKVKSDITTFWATLIKIIDWFKHWLIVKRQYEQKDWIQFERRIFLPSMGMHGKMLFVYDLWCSSCFCLMPKIWAIAQVVHVVQQLSNFASCIQLL